MSSDGNASSGTEQCGWDGCGRTEDVRVVADETGEVLRLCRPCRDEWPSELSEKLVSCQFCGESHLTLEDHEDHVEQEHYAEVLRNSRSLETATERSEGSR